MAMVNVVLPTGGYEVQADRFGPKVGSHLALVLLSPNEPCEPMQ